ncbi:MAG TPA: proton-conducting transporter membrane subunit [Verrucomicrobiae bacterium]|nr:proton-conducting transporter membrane subunit [Verrucomicrobiae bacterium]
MSCLLSALALLLVGAASSLFFGASRGRLASSIAAGLAVAASVVGLIPAIQVLATGVPLQFHFAWPVPAGTSFGEFFIELDRLSAWFLLPTLLLSGLCAIYGVGYLRSHAGRRSLGPVWCFYHLLVLGMVLVLLSRNAVLFIVAWELMALASFFLVTFEHERESVRNAGWIYLVATHLGTGFLLALFILTARETGSLDFNVWAAKGIHSPQLAGTLFLFATVGFGTKAGFMPLHVWLPEAHPAAPSHVSALMSGAMIKMGIYGLMRSLTFLGPPAAWWGWVLLCVGLGSGALGIIFAAAQHDLKRLLAYSSVENIGLITAGLGLGLLGIANHEPLMAMLGFAAALLHTLNHALFKGLLFLSAGSVAHAAGTLNINRLGGLIKKLPWTGALFLVGAVAICGLPPLNGFFSELLLAGASLKAIVNAPAETAMAGLLALMCLGLIGGFAAVTFAKAFGIVFLGEPRERLASPHESGVLMIGPILILGAGCALVSLFAPVLPRCLLPLAAGLSGEDAAAWPQLVPGGSLVFAMVAAIGLLLLIAFVVLALVRRTLLTGRIVGETETWGCGYLRPSPRIQYTASSFVQPVTSLFRWLLGARGKLERPEGIFPAKASLTTETPDLSHEELYRPGFLKLNWGISKLRWMQQGHVQLYVLYIAITLIVLLAWKFR